MTYSIDSYFYHTLQQKSLVLDEPTPVNCYGLLRRRFTINNSDYSSRVKRWPTFRNSYDQVKSNQFTVELANHDQALNFFREEKRYMASSCDIYLEHNKHDYTTTGIKHTSSLHGYFTNSWGDTTSIAINDFTLESIFRINEIGSCAVGLGVNHIIGVSRTTVGAATGNIYRLSVVVTSNNAVNESSIFATHNFDGEGFRTVRVYLKNWPGQYYDGISFHVIATRKNGSHFSLYLNDSLVSSISVGSYEMTDPNSHFMYILQNSFGSTLSYFNYDFDMIRAYNKYMSPDDTAKMFNGVYENLDNAFAYYPFYSEPAGGQDDASGLGNHLKINSGGNQDTGIYYDPVLYPNSYYDGFRYDFTEVNCNLVGIAQISTLSLLKGTITAYQYEGSKVRLTIQDKFKAFEERIVGTSDAPVDYTGSNHLASDIAWYLCTSFGGLDTTKSTANTDIDYTSFSAWAAIFSGDSVFCEGIFKGVKVTEALRKIAKMTKSAIYQEENKLFFQRFVEVDSQSIYIDKSKYINLKTETNIKDITNKQYVFAGYDTTSRYHSITVVSSNEPSVNSFGIFENKIQDTSLWYVGSASATNLAERVTVSEGEPYEKVTAKTALFGAIAQIGDTLYIDDPSIGMDNEVFRVLHRDYDMHNSSVILRGDQTNLGTVFKLDYSAMDSSDTLA